MSENSKYSTWKATWMPVGDLFLDPLNPRIPSRRRVLSQKSLIQDLIAHDDILGIAQSIAKKGFYPNESLIATRVNGKTFILEGNRRLAACMLLLKPELAIKKEDAQRFKFLSSDSDLSGIKELPVVIAPNREAADSIIASRHTISPIKPWSPINQAFFYARKIEQGYSIQEVCEKFDVPRNLVEDSLIISKIFEVANSLPMPKDVKDIIGDERKFEVSALERIILSKDGKKVFDLNVDSKGSVSFKKITKPVSELLKKIIIDVARKNQTTRTLNKTKAVRNYLIQTGGKGIKKILDTKIKQQKATVSKSIIPRYLRCTVKNQRIQDVFKELSKINPNQYINSHSVSLRMLIELATYYYLDKTGQIKTLKKETALALKKKGRNFPQNFPGLFVMLKWLSVNDATLSDAVKDSLKRFLDKNASNAALLDLNLYVHKYTYYPDKKTVEEIWKNLSDYLSYILNYKN